ncbi:MAG TPA: N-formylglutamate deformylase [Burkholderiaceae bacterium]|jgi:N-formylglutamate deformylase|nr:N-formylglutamate deformylase [Burkholderiaceae bacterium]
MSEAGPVFSLQQGSARLLVSLPHCGTWVPSAISNRMVPRAQALEDTDWHLAQLYAFARDLGASLIVPRFSRYVIDLNRPPDDAPMYSGVNTTGLCPERFFSGEALYRPDQQPDQAEVAQRRERYWQPYHDALSRELDRLKGVHGHALLLDGHSIKSELPWLFSGRLPDLNLGTAEGTTCAPSLRGALTAALQTQHDFTHVVDGRFKGGYIVRRYGRPAERVHAAQLEMCWSCYMSETPPFRLDPQRSARLAPILLSLVRAMLEWNPSDD